MNEVLIQLNNPTYTFMSMYVYEQRYEHCHNYVNVITCHMDAETSE